MVTGPLCAFQWRNHKCEMPKDHEGEHECACGRMIEEKTKSERWADKGGF